MQKTYKLCKEVQGMFDNTQIQPFGPYMTLQQAGKYADDMRLAGFKVMVKNMESV